MTDAIHSPRTLEYHHLDTTPLHLLFQPFNQVPFSNNEKMVVNHFIHVTVSEVLICVRAVL
jgi:hypothetical protein